MPTKVHLFKAIVFPIVTYECESWTIKKAEHQRIDAFEPWCWWRLLRVLWTARRSNKSVLKEISPEYPLEGLKLKCWTWNAEAETTILWAPNAKNWLIVKDPDTRKDWRQEEKGITEGEIVGWHHWLDGHEPEEALGVGDGQGNLACCSPWGCKESDTTEQLNWTEKEDRPEGATRMRTKDSKVVIHTKEIQKIQWGLETRAISLVTVLEVRSLNHGVGRARISPKCNSLHLPPYGGSWHSWPPLAYDSITLYHCHCMAFSLLSLYPFLF